eukprot:TRINITY_DN2584_c0_g2_i5.p1 TRINITY_DN2584_c0_g2~~TRINITY_DN2584_c0_g2_i5.p1  ORF type:complete len:583 (-),score=101.02 TRINITY_DN2584_c0_g2_i5:264-2012(-)
MSFGVRKFKHLVANKRWYCDAVYDETLLDVYNKLVKNKILQTDVQQIRVVERLNQLWDDLRDFSYDYQDFKIDAQFYQAKRDSYVKTIKLQEDELRDQLSGQRLQSYSLMDQFRAMMNRSQPKAQDQKEIEKQILDWREQQISQNVGAPPISPPPPRGVYIYGSVGSGKSILMDLFYQQVIQEQFPLQNWRRLHFTAAMQELHCYLHQIESSRLNQLKNINNSQKIARSALLAAKRRQRLLKLGQEAEVKWNESTSPDVEFAAYELLTNNQNNNNNNINGEKQSQKQSQNQNKKLQIAPGLLCFDEVQTPDVFSAIALKGVMEVLISNGCTIVSTSNRHPEELSRAGLHEEFFQHFVETLSDKCDIVELDNNVDYRQVHLKSVQTQKYENYFWPLDQQSAKLLGSKWQQQMDGGHQDLEMEVPVLFGRTLKIPKSTKNQKGQRCAYFDFEQLCGGVVGPPDFLALAQNFEVVFLSGIPAMSLSTKDKARRFITLVDELYNHRAQLVCSAECSPQNLFTGVDGEEPVVDFESLQFESQAEGQRLRRDVMSSGGVSPVASKQGDAEKAARQLGGFEEQFAFKRA